MNAVLDLGQNSGFIWMAYGISTLVMVGLIGWIRLDARRQLDLLSDLESRGITRRSARKKPSK